MGAQPILAGQIQQAFANLDVLFINAGIVDMRPLEQWDEAAFDRSFVFFASDESAFTVGSELIIDGGMSNL